METHNPKEVETKSNAQPPKKGLQKNKSTTLKKVDLESAKLLQQYKDKINKKQFGRKIRDQEIIAMGLRLITQEHLNELQEATYGEKDRLYLAHESFQRAHGKIGLDQFIGKLLRGEVSQKL